MTLFRRTDVFEDGTANVIFEYRADDSRPSGNYSVFEPLHAGPPPSLTHTTTHFCKRVLDNSSLFLLDYSFMLLLVDEIQRDPEFVNDPIIRPYYQRLNHMLSRYQRVRRIGSVSVSKIYNSFFIALDKVYTEQYLPLTQILCIAARRRAGYYECPPNLTYDACRYLARETIKEAGNDSLIIVPCSQE